MFISWKSKKFQTISQLTTLVLIILFPFAWIVPPTTYAQNLPEHLNLPNPGTLLPPTAAFQPMMIRAVTIDPSDPLKFNFILDRGNSKLPTEAIQEESMRLIKYFLATLTVPEEDLWVNLSPYEKDRIIPNIFGFTEMGRDLLAQDYLLKQLTASINYPETGLGKKFWDTVYQKAQELYGTTEIPLNTFNKVWIVPDKAIVYEKNNTAFVAGSHLKVMLEEDYLALKNNMSNADIGLDQVNEEDAKNRSGFSSTIVKDILIPAIEKEVNQGKSFTTLRQIYNSMILATWYKQNLKESLLGQVYVNQNKVKGIALEDKKAKEKIYQQYLEAFKKGVYNYIKEDIDLDTRKPILRKYFSGGIAGPELAEKLKKTQDFSSLPDEEQHRLRAFEAAQTNGDPDDDAFSEEVALVENAGAEDIKVIPSSSEIVSGFGDTAMLAPSHETDFSKMTLQGINGRAYEGKVIAIRVDHNVPMRNGQIIDDNRIVQSLPTIEAAIEQGAKVVIISHLENPQDEITRLTKKYQDENGLSPTAAQQRATQEVESKLSLFPIAQRLQELLQNRKIYFNPAYRTTADAQSFILSTMKNGEVLVLENVRFNREEDLVTRAEAALSRATDTNRTQRQQELSKAQRLDQAFADRLFQGVDLYVLDGFGVSHRGHVSVKGAPAKINRVAGILLEKELVALDRVRNDLNVAVMGGSKVSDKIKVIDALLSGSPNLKLLIGGAMANAFLVAEGFDVGAAIGAEAREVALARDLISRYGEERIITPKDVVIAASFEESAKHKEITLGEEEIPEGWQIVDIGHQTIARYRDIIKGNVFMNGNMGASDKLSFAQAGTREILQAVADEEGTIGGGNTVEAMGQFGITGFGHISTGGGASLEYLEGKTLPGVAALSVTPQALIKELSDQFDQRLRNGDTDVVQAIVDFNQNIPRGDQQHQVLYEWLQRHPSSLAADAIAKVGLNWPNMLSKLLDIATGRSQDGNPRAAARQIKEMMAEGNLAGIGISTNLQSEAKQAWDSHPEIHALVEKLPRLPFPQVQTGVKPGVLLILRHGQTNWSEPDEGEPAPGEERPFNKWSGWLQAEITTRGRNDARHAGVALQGIPFNVAMTSDLLRARQTMDEFLIGLGVNIPRESSAAINEKSYGFMGGWRRTDVQTMVGRTLYEYWRRATNGRAPGAESLDDVIERGNPYLVESILARIARGENVVISLHNNSGRAILASLREHTNGKPMTDQELLRLELPLGRPIAVTFDENLNHKEYWSNQTSLEEVRNVLVNATTDRALLTEINNEVDLMVQDHAVTIRQQMIHLYGKTKAEADAMTNNKFAKLGFEGEHNRLGWGLTHLNEILQPENRAMLEQVKRDAQMIRSQFKYVIFSGMGGSGLSVETVKSTFGEPDGLTLFSLRTTDPAVIDEMLNKIAQKEGGDLRAALEKTFIVVISKSGTTQETRSHKEYFEELTSQMAIAPKEDHFMLVTDLNQGSPMETEARQKGYLLRSIQLNQKADIGGRFTSPTTNVFLLPLALVTPNLVEPILERARAMNDVPADQDVFTRLGLYLYQLATKYGRDKVTFLVPAELRDLPMWSEQLFEESLGKGGKGVTIFYGERLNANNLKGIDESDRVFIRLNLGDQETQKELVDTLKDKKLPVFDINLSGINDLGGVMLGFQRTVATIAYLWDIVFVDQPGVNKYKDETNAVMATLEPGATVQVPATWQSAGYGQKLKVYYSPLIEAGITTETEIENEVQFLGGTMDNGAAVYAALLSLAQRKGLLNAANGKPGTFEVAELASYGHMTSNFRKIMEDARAAIFTDLLGVASKLAEGPDKNHSFQQNIADGKDMFFSTYTMPLVTRQPEALAYSDNPLRAQAIGTVQSLMKAGRKAVFITLNSTIADAEGEMEQFFKDVQYFLQQTAADRGLRLLVNKVGRNEAPLSPAEFEMLKTLTLSDKIQREVFGVTETNVEFELRERIDLFQKTLPGFETLMKEEKINDMGPDIFWRIYIPLSRWMYQQKMKKRPNEAYVAGFYGSLGIGKTTRTKILNLVLTELLKDRGEQVVVWSIDDLYKTKAERELLKPKGYTRRGLPGTHDVQLGVKILRELRSSTETSVVEIPMFAKREDDRVGFRTVQGKVGIVIFEGWMVGANTDFNPELVEPGFKQTVAYALKEYADLNAELDDLIVRKLLDIDSIKVMYRNQVERERASVEQSGLQWNGLQDDEIEPFVESFYEGPWDFVNTSPEPNFKDISIEVTTDKERRILEMRLGGRVTETPDKALLKTSTLDTTVLDARAVSTEVEQPKRVGGINLDPKLLDLQIKRDGNGIPLPMNAQPIRNMKIDGFFPVIINITPVQNLPFLLGINKESKDVPTDLGFDQKKDPLIDRREYAQKASAI